jgi:hypothetical protein
MVKSETPDATSCVSKELGSYPAGLMITFSSAVSIPSSQYIMNSREPGMQTSPQEVNISRVKDYGLGEESLMMAQQSSLMKSTVISLVRISPSEQTSSQKTLYIPTILTTLTSSHTNSKYPGSYQRTCLSHQPLLTLDLIGTLKLTKYPWVARRKRNIFEPQKNGCCISRVEHGFG